MIVYRTDPVTGLDVADVTFAWNPVTEYEDGSVVAIRGYEVFTGPTDDGPWTQVTSVDGETTQAVLSGLEVGRTVWVTVRAIPVAGPASDYRAPEPFVLAVDTTPPPVPSAPTATAVLGSVIASWDGLLVAATPSDFDRVEVHASTTNGFTPSASTLAGTLTKKGSVQVANPTNSTMYLRLRSVDRRGNTSAATAQVTMARDTTPPPAPAGLSAVFGVGFVTVSWAGTLASTIPPDFSHIELSRDSSTTLTGTLTQAGSIRPTNAANTNYTASARSVDIWGNRSGWTTVTVNKPAAPAAPTAPVPTSRLGVVQVAWDGALTVGTTENISHVEVHIGTTSTFTPDGTTLVNTMPRKGMVQRTGLTLGSTYYVRLRAVDVWGSTSAATASVSVVIVGVSGPDLEANSVTANEIAAGAIDGMEITGATIQTSPPGSGLARVEIDTYGLRLTDTTGASTVDFDATTGRATMIGKIATDFDTEYPRTELDTNLWDHNLNAGIGGPAEGPLVPTHVYTERIGLHGYFEGNPSDAKPFIGMQASFTATGSGRVPNGEPQLVITPALPQDTGWVGSTGLFITRDAGLRINNGGSLSGAGYLMLGEGGGGNLGQASLSASGTGGSGEVYIHHNLPTRLNGSLGVNIGSGATRVTNPQLKVRDAGIEVVGTVVASSTVSATQFTAPTGAAILGSASGAVLKFGATDRVATTSTGVNVNGTIASQSGALTLNGASGNGVNLQMNGTTRLSTTATGVAVSSTVSSVSGVLTLTGSGGLALQHNGSTKMATTSTGVTVTGTMTAGIIDARNGVSASTSAQTFNAGTVSTFNSGWSTSSAAGTGYTSTATVPLTINRAGLWAVTITLHKVLFTANARGFLAVQADGTEWRATMHGENRATVTIVRPFPAGTAFTIQGYTDGSNTTANLTLDAYQIA